MKMIDLTKEREAFEAWLIKKFDLPPKSFSLNFCDGAYESIPTQARWEAWIERAKAQSVPVWISTDFMLPDEDEAVLFMDKNNVIHDGYLSTDYVDGPYGENGEDFGDNQTLWASNSNGNEFLLNKVKYWMHRPISPSASKSGADQ